MKGERDQVTIVGVRDVHRLVVRSVSAERRQGGRVLLLTVAALDPIDEQWGSITIELSERTASQVGILWGK